MLSLVTRVLRPFSSSRTTRAKVLATVVMVGLVLTSCSTSTTTAGSTPIAVKAPVLTEDFGPGPCAQDSQIAMDYCAGDQLLAADDLVNAQVRFLFAVGFSTTMKRQIVDAQTAWLRWRDAYCQVVEDFYQGGSILPLYTSDCEASADTQDSQSLLGLYQSTVQGDAQLSLWPTAEKLTEHAAGVAACLKLYLLTNHSITGQPARRVVSDDVAFVAREARRSHDPTLEADLPELFAALHSGDTGEYVAVEFMMACDHLGVKYES